MFSRVFLAAGVAALAIAAPASADKGGRGKGEGQSAERHGGGGDGGERRGGGGFERQDRGGERQQARQFERRENRGFERSEARQFERRENRDFGRREARQFERRENRDFGRREARQLERREHRDFDRREARSFERQRQFDRREARDFERQRGFDRRIERIAQREQMRANGIQQSLADQQQFAIQQFRDKDMRFARNAFAQHDWAPVYRTLSFNDVQVVPVTQVSRFIGSPLAAITGFNLSPLPTTVQYLYPETDDYYYRYGNGYLYQVDRGDNLIASLIPLLAGGFMPGQYLPASYMNSYVPDYYGFNSFYPDYDDTCNRYYYGVVYQVDCDDGYVENVIPMYAGGYGVGQLLPAAYSTYNVPTQYRSLYYDTPDYGYWYSPGAIYQYDNRSSMITSVAALLSPGFSVGQPIPAGYDIYNVPYQYRSTYYDTDDAWYRYNNGYIYQVDPTTQLVTAIVASLLT